MKYVEKRNHIIESGGDPFITDEEIYQIMMNRVNEQSERELAGHNDLTDEAIEAIQRSEKAAPNRKYYASVEYKKYYEFLKQTLDSEKFEKYVAGLPISFEEIKKMWEEAGIE